MAPAYRRPRATGKRPQFGIGRTIANAFRGRASFIQEGQMKRIRVEPISSYLERYRKGPVYVATVSNGLVYLSGLPPFDPETGDIRPVPFERQAAIVMEQMKLCLEASGSSLEQVLKCNVYCTPNPSHFAIFNEVYGRYFPTDAPARIFMHVPSWPGPFDVEVDCVAEAG
jgi:2-iminobutanoate/2-iminopropanoate deaminase